MKEYNEKNIVLFYEKLGSIRAVSEQYQISEGKVRKILISNNAYATDMSKKIKELQEKGLNAQQIQSVLHISKSAYNANVPYSKCMYGIDNATKNAKKLRCWHEKQKLKKEKQN